MTQLTNTVGYVPVAFEMRIADENGNELSAGEMGELQFRAGLSFP